MCVCTFYFGFNFIHFASISWFVRWNRNLCHSLSLLLPFLFFSTVLWWQTIPLWHKQHMDTHRNELNANWSKAYMRTFEWDVLYTVLFFLFFCLFFLLFLLSIYSAQYCFSVSLCHRCWCVVVAVSTHLTIDCVCVYARGREWTKMKENNKKRTVYLALYRWFFSPLLPKSGSDCLWPACICNIRQRVIQ